MVEVMAAILIFGLMISGIVALQGSTLNMIRNNRHRSVAANLASQEMDTVRSTPFTTLQSQVGLLQTTVTTLDNIPYTVARETEWVPAGATSGACDAPAGADPAYLRVSVSVSWSVMRGVEPVNSQTVITPPVGTYDPNAGHLAVEVLDRDAVPESGVQVTLTGPEGSTQVTDSDGCAFFGFLTPGSYTATLSKAGFVSTQGLTSPSQTSAVSTGAISSLLFEYDQAATLVLTLVGKDVGASPPSTVPVTLANTALLPTGTKVVTGSGSPRTIGSLFPFDDGYEAWAGSCADADPLTSVAFPVTPGQSTSGSVLMPEVLVIVVDGADVPQPGQAVSAVHSAMAGCTSGLTYTMTPTNAAGQSLFALPYGTWQIRINGITKATITLSPSDPVGPKIVKVTA
jgi:hypothetical protein